MRRDPTTFTLATHNGIRRIQAADNYASYGFVVWGFRSVHIAQMTDNIYSVGEHERAKDCDRSREVRRREWRSEVVVGVNGTFG